MRTPRPGGGCHQCCTSPSGNWRPRTAASCSRSSCGLGVDQRHRVLQLVAEAEGAAGLVEAAARPDAAGERLVEQPAVGQDVERGVGRLHLHRAERVLPVRQHRVERLRARRGAAEALHELRRPRRRCGPCRGGRRPRAPRRRPSSIGTWIAAHGSSAAPTRPESRVRAQRGRLRAAMPLRPRNSVRSPVTLRGARLARRRRSRRGRRTRCCRRLRASSAPVSASISVTTCGAVLARRSPSTHST